jgi:hypothetical protein
MEYVYTPLRGYFRANAARFRASACIDWLMKKTTSADIATASATPVATEVKYFISLTA